MAKGRAVKNQRKTERNKAVTRKDKTTNKSSNVSLSNLVSVNNSYNLSFETTRDIQIPKETICQVIGQEAAVEVIKKAASQKRHVLLIGEPGTGKSMLGAALAELLPKENLKDVLAYPNPNDENNPKIVSTEAGKGREIITKAKSSGKEFFKNQNFFLVILLIFSLVAPWWVRTHYTVQYGATVGAIMFASFSIASMLFLGAFFILLKLGNKQETKSLAPKLLVDNFNKQTAPFYDGTGAHAGALLGDILHDPYQSGGLGTPAHERVMSGLIHKADQGVLFIDEIGTLNKVSQQELLTALQEGRFPITGQSEISAGAMVRTDAVPCNFVLIAAGNLQTIKHMHPALRSRIRGYGYEVYMNESMPDTIENREKLAVFVAQEVAKDNQNTQKIPHFTKDAVDAIIDESRKRANKKGHLTLRLRDLGGIIRAAGDIAKQENAEFVLRKHIEKAREIARTLEHQIADRLIEDKKDYEVILTAGKKIGRVNCIAVIGSKDVFSGIILPIEAQAIPSVGNSTITLTGKVSQDDRESAKNVIAVVENYFGFRKKYNFYVQFLQTFKSSEIDSTSAGITVAIISALKQKAVRQDTAVIGAVSVRGEILPVAGVSSKVHAALEAGISRVIVPKNNVNDILLDPADKEKVEIIKAEKIEDVIREMVG
ncbi:TPA: ATP-dependent protease LonB [Candidatus Woesearchaeota archaeon]|nr:ATP-dependent protease LonB [Candidatus Woesearchaeota archaeon]